LVRYVGRGLDAVELTQGQREIERLILARITQKTNLAGFLRIGQSGDRAAKIRGLQAAGIQVQKVHPVRRKFAER
jgi:hypothetical protein